MCFSGVSFYFGDGSSISFGQLLLLKNTSLREKVVSLAFAISGWGR